MAGTVTAARATTPRKMLAMGGEGLRKPLAELDHRRAIGRAIERALEYADLTKQQASGLMGYPDQSALSRWISGAETPQLAKLWTLGPRFRHGFVIALADNAADDGVEVRTTITLRTTRGVA